MNDLTQRQRDDLDRQLTGNHGEDSVPDDPPACPECGAHEMRATDDSDTCFICQDCGFVFEGNIFERKS